MVAVLVVAYVVAALVSARLLAGHLAWKWKSQFVERPEMLDWLTAGLVGLLGGLVWPALLVAGGTRRLALPGVGAEREAQQLARTQAQQRELEEKQQHLAQLEHETGLDGSGTDDDA